MNKKKCFEGYGACSDCQYNDETCSMCDSCINGNRFIAKIRPVTETDPNGIAQHDPGSKLDQGKLLAGILQQWPRALTAVLEVATFGAHKYTRGGWMHVENGVERYTDAMFRHLLKEPIEPIDPDSGLSHQAHVAWNALSRLELQLKEKK